MTSILIIGATGMTGHSLVSEAVSNGFSVIANGRSSRKLNDLSKEFKGIDILKKDATELTTSDLENVDVVLDAFATDPKHAYLHVDLATHLIALLRNTSKRVGFILGAGSLYTNGTKKELVYDLIMEDGSTKSWREVPESQMYELEFLRGVKNVDWFGVSPGENYIQGEKAGRILVGKDVLLVNDKMVSETTTGTMAFKVIEELKNKQYHQSRFTVVDG